MTITNFDRTQQAVETVIAYVNHLEAQGKPRREAIDHAAQRFGIERARLAALLNGGDAVSGAR